MIPAIIHVDGTGRLQTVHKETNLRYYRLIEHFRDLTGIPLVLNTCFNENEPVICYPEEALDCFLRTQIDILVLRNFWIARAKSLQRRFLIYFSAKRSKLGSSEGSARRADG